MFKDFKIATGYNVNYHNHCIPKNAIYGRLTPTVYIYITDFASFYNDAQVAKIHIMDIKKHDHFKQYLVKNTNVIFKLAHDFIHSKGISPNTKCENVLCINRTYKPTERRVGEYTYKPTGRDHSRDDFMQGIKYRELTQGGYNTNTKASMVATGVKPQNNDHGYDHRTDGMKIVDRHVSYRNTVNTAWDKPEVRVRKW